MIFLLAYILGIFLTWFPVSKRILRSSMLGGSKPDSEDLVFSLIFGLLVALIWPMTWLIIGAAAVLRRETETEESTEIPPHDTSMW